ncbi:nuclear transport factor 2 family protein [Emcibacter nanhaiensis]|uniref:Nuclear transport factor 2 family protein n=1 Tax=Emcibacter nanhaiensis TaxID=1505037 RepID=A0A501PTB6_9PROT|nr:nuclear transport factor 2 family protein [Emcibacter nanhaiensis]TPD63799.1 nuclear transport factor 2 family protein [Emcibacter nanhaiensis]
MSNTQIEDQLAIQELISTFFAAAMRRDSAKWGDTFAEDGSWKIDMLDEPVVGRDKVVAVYENLMQHIEFVSISGFPNELAIDGDKATGKVYSQEFITRKNGDQMTLVGCHHDEYVKKDGRWYFQSRRFETLRRA